MNDISNFFQSLADGLQGALQAVNLLPALVIALLIAMFTANTRHGLKALIAVVLVFAVRMVPGAINGHVALPNMPDFRRLAAIVEIILMYVFAYGIIAVVGNLKTSMKLGAAKSAH